MNEPHDEPPPGLRDRLGYLLGQAHLAHRRAAEAQLASLGLGVKESGALSVLAAEGPLSQQRLGERMGVDRTTMVAVVDELEREGLVERQRNSEDRRAYALQPTSQGLRVLGRANRAVGRAEAEFLAQIPAREQRRLKDTLRRLISS